MRIVLDNVEPKYIGILNELAQALQFTVSAIEKESKKEEINRRIEQLETGKTDLISPDWAKISVEVQTP